MDMVCRQSYGVHHWKEGMGEGEDNELMCEACSISDEAFALLILYNNWDKWCAEMSTLPQKVDTYFMSIQMGCHKFQGQSDEGIAQYNELFEQIKTDRQTPHGKAREMEYLDQLKAARGTRKWVREQPEFQQVIIRAKNNLFLNKLRQCDDDGSNADGSEAESINTIAKQQFNTKIEFIMRTQLLLLNEFMYLVLCIANKIVQLLQ